MNSPIDRRCWLALGFVFLGLAGANGADVRPNILFIFSDDHAYQAISCYGSKINKTPNLDRIASEGMRFDRCLVTNSICGPSRAVVLTGKYSHLNGFATNHNRFDGSQQTVAKLLQKAGYQTAVVGKWHLVSEPTGFDYWHILQGQGPYYNPAMITPSGIVNHTGYTTDIITDVALDWLKKRDGNKPFFLMYQHKAPHRNWQPSPKHLDLYEDETIPEPETLFDDYSHRAKPASQQEMTIARYLSPHDLKLVKQAGLTKEQEEEWSKAYGPKNEKFREQNLTGDDLVRWKYQRYMKDYLRCIASVDENVGRVLDWLEETGLDKNTVVIYASDQGFYLGEHGWYDKRWMYEESLRTPFMVRWPGKVKPSSARSELVSNLDFAETFLAIAGEPIPEDMQGESLVPLLVGEPAPKDWRKSFYYHYYEFPGAHAVRKHLGVRTERHKLIHFYDSDEWELFDLQADPHEMHSVYGDPKYAEVEKELKVELERLRKHYGDDKDPRSARRASAPSVKPDEVKFELARHFDFGKGEKWSSGKVAQGRKGKSIELAGKGAAVSLPSSAALNPAGKPLAIGGWVKADAKAKGVIAAHGGESHGWSLYLFDGVPHFTIRRDMDEGTIFAADALDEGWHHVVAALNAQGEAQLFVDGQPAGKAAKLGFILQQPNEGLDLGADSGSLVGNYNNSLPFTGQLEDVRLYWGPLNAKSLEAWSQ